MIGLKIDTKHIQLLCEGVVSKFGHTYPLVFPGDN